MKIETDRSKMLVLGATRRLIVQQALARGHDVNQLHRAPLISW